MDLLMRWARRALALIWLAVPLAACGAADAPPSPAAQIRMLERGQAAAEARWEQTRPAAYRLVTEYVTLGIDVTMTVEVRGGALASHECRPNKRQIVIDCGWAAGYPEQFTVDGLFAHARTRREGIPRYADMMEPREVLAVAYDETFGYPRLIRWEPPEATHWRVTAFEPLP